MNPLISVIIPVYNADQYLEECLESVLAQTWQPLEVILIDDGSADGSREILESYVRKYHHFTAIFQENAGVSRARNAGLEKARGEYIAFCDSDDIIAPEMLEELAANLMETGADMSCCAVSRFLNSEKPRFWAGQGRKVLEGDGMYAAVVQNPDCAGYSCNKLFRKAVLSEPVRFPADLAILEDEVFVLEALAHCRRICTTDAVLYGYRDHPNSARNQRLSERKLTEILGRERILQILQSAVQSQELISSAWNDLMRTYAVAYKKLLHTIVENRPFWRDRIKQGFRSRKEQGTLDGSWSIKLRIYYLLLCLAAR